jgi:replicative DNA helicase
MDALVNLDAERTCVGSVLVDNSALAVLEGIVSPQHFSDSCLRTLFAAMLAMGSAGRQIDAVTLKDELGSQYESIGGAALLAELMDGLPRLQNVDEWARIVRAKYSRRAAVQLAESFIKRAMDDTVSIEELLDTHHGNLSKLMDHEERGIVKICDLVKPAFEKVEEFASSADGIVGLPTGLRSVDEATGGMKPGELWIIGGRPSRGKSAFCTQVAVHVARRAKRVLVFSMEMPPVTVVRRMFFSEAGVDRFDLRRHGRSDKAWNGVNKAFGDLHPLPLWFDGRESPTLQQIRSAARRHEAKHGLDLIVVDYLQRCSIDTKQDRWVAVGDVAKGLKNLALALDVPVLAACQLNAEAEEKRPTMADLAQARQVIAAEADLIAFLHPEQPGEWRKQDYPQVNFLLDKQRDGATVCVPLSFERVCTRFVEMGGHVGSSVPGIEVA